MLDRKTVRRYVQAAVDAGLVREGGDEQLTDELLGAVVEAARPSRPRGRGGAWEQCESERDRISAWLDEGVPVVKVADLFARRGRQVPQRSCNGSALRSWAIAPVADGEPGGELQMDFGRLGYLVDAQGRRRLLRALIFTAVCSAHVRVVLPS